MLISARTMITVDSSVVSRLIFMTNESEILIKNLSCNELRTHIYSNYCTQQLTCSFLKRKKVCFSPANEHVKRVHVGINYENSLRSFRVYLFLYGMGKNYNAKRRRLQLLWITKHSKVNQTPMYTYLQNATHENRNSVKFLLENYVSSTYM